MQCWDGRQGTSGRTWPVLALLWGKSQWTRSGVNELSVKGQTVNITGFEGPVVHTVSSQLVSSALAVKKTATDNT